MATYDEFLRDLRASGKPMYGVYDFRVAGDEDMKIFVLVWLPEGTDEDAADLYLGQKLIDLRNDILKVAQGNFYFRTASTSQELEKGNVLQNMIADEPENFE